MTIIKTGMHIRTQADMISVTAWLNQHITADKWRWKVSDEWIRGWGHPMLVEFDETVDKEIITIFALSNA